MSHNIRQELSQPAAKKKIAQAFATNVQTAAKQDKGEPALTKFKEVLAEVAALDAAAAGIGVQVLTVQSQKVEKVDRETTSSVTTTATIRGGTTTTELLILNPAMMSVDCRCSITRFILLGIMIFTF